MSSDVTEVVVLRDDRMVTLTLDRPADQKFEWSHDVDEGAAAHREGRPPRFTGR